LDDKKDAEFLGHSMSGEGALLVGTMLRYTVTKAERQHAELKEDADGSRAQRTGAPARPSILNGSRESLEEALAPIRKAADWYEKVARLGFDVEARRF